MTQKEYELKCEIEKLRKENKELKIKNEGYANVDYTEKKHIRKAKGTGLGMVYYDNYKTLFIDFKDKLYDKYKK